MPPLVKYADSYSGLRQPQQTSGQTVMAIIGMMMEQARQKQAQKNYEEQVKEAQGQQTFLNEMARGRMMQDEADRQLKTQYYNRMLDHGAGGAAANNTALRAALEVAGTGGTVDTTKLPPEQRAIVEAVSQQFFDDATREHEAAAGVAEALNRKLRTEGLLKGYKQSAQDFSTDEDARWYNPTTWGRMFVKDSDAHNFDVERVKTLEKELPGVLEQEKMIRANPEQMQAVRFDAARGEYVPIVPKPKDRRIRTTNTANTPAATQTQTGRGVPFLPDGNIRMRTSDGTIIDVPANNVEAVLQRDPMATVLDANAPIRFKSGGLVPFLPGMGGGSGGGFNPLAMLMPGMGGMPFGGGGGGMNMMMPWLSLLRQPGFFNKATGNEKMDMFADGGMVEGRGSSTSDNVKARLSPNEYVLPAESMEIPGGYETAEALRKAGLMIRMSRNKPVKMNMGGMTWDYGTPTPEVNAYLAGSSGALGPRTESLGPAVAGAAATKGGGFDWGSLLMSILKSRQGGARPHLLYNYDVGGQAAMSNPMLNFSGAY